MKRLSVVILLFCCVSAVAEPPTIVTFERILVPVFITERTGAYGTRWRSDLVMRNNADTPAAIFQFFCVFTCQCVALCGQQLSPPHSLVTQYFVQEGPYVGILVYVDRAVANQLDINLQVRDASRYARGMGTEIPVVRDRDFLSGNSELLNIPVDPGVRLLLRIYGISSNSGSGDMVVRVLPIDSDNVIAERRVTMMPPPGWDRIPDPEFMLAYPGFLELPLGDLIGASSGPVRVELRPVDPSLVYWAFVSATDNVTQHVTTVTPQ